MNNKSLRNKPNATTEAALQASRDNEVERVDSIEELFEDANDSDTKEEG